MVSTTGGKSEMLTTKQAAEYLNIKTSSLITWRCTQAVKIPYVKIGHSVRYRKCDLDTFIEENLVGYRDAGAGI